MAWTQRTAKPGAVDTGLRKVGLWPGSWSIGRESFQSTKPRGDPTPLYTRTVDISFLFLLKALRSPWMLEAVVTGMTRS